MPNFREEFATNRRIMDSFIGIRFKKETAKRFQEFSRKHFKSHTEAMATMLDFFRYNEISPREKLGPTGRTIEASIKKRINAVIAIMRDVEKTQTKPTASMIASLFQAEEPKNKPLILEKKFVEEKKEVRFKEKQNQTNKL
jgi:phosphoribosyl-ATP pyrophosphohydrolase